MALDDCFHGDGNGSVGIVLPRIMWNRTHRRDRVPDFWPLPDAAPALPIVDPLSEPDVATTFIVLTGEERAQVA